LAETSYKMEHAIPTWNLPLYNLLISQALAAYSAHNDEMARRRAKKDDRQQLAKTIDRIATRLAMTADQARDGSSGERYEPSEAITIPQSEMTELLLLCSNEVAKKHGIGKVDEVSLRAVIDQLHAAIEPAVSANVFGKFYEYMGSMDSAVEHPSALGTVSR
jgi:hypothetical protein